MPPYDRSKRSPLLNSFLAKTALSAMFDSLRGVEGLSVVVVVRNLWCENSVSTGTTCWEAGLASAAFITTGH